MIFFRDCDILGYPTCPSRNDLDNVIEVLSKLSLFWNDEEMYGLVTNLNKEIQVDQKEHATVENN